MIIVTAQPFLLPLHPRNLVVSVWSQLLPQDAFDRSNSIDAQILPTSYFAMPSSPPRYLWYRCRRKTSNACCRMCRSPFHTKLHLSFSTAARPDHFGSASGLPIQTLGIDEIRTVVPFEIATCWRCYQRIECGPPTSSPPMPAPRGRNDRPLLVLHNRKQCIHSAACAPLERRRASLYVVGLCVSFLQKAQ